MSTSLILAPRAAVSLGVTDNRNSTSELSDGGSKLRGTLTFKHINLSDFGAARGSFLGGHWQQKSRKLAPVFEHYHPEILCAYVCVSCVYVCVSVFCCVVQVAHHNFWAPQSQNPACVCVCVMCVCMCVYVFFCEMQVASPNFWALQSRNPVRVYVCRVCVCLCVCVCVCDSIQAAPLSL